ncbi:MAG: hypothetical protein WEE89_04280 [Gemmatimonadota bacterium]
MQAEIAALRWASGARQIGMYDLANLLDVDVRKLERVWRGQEELDRSSRSRLADLLAHLQSELQCIQAQLRKDVASQGTQIMGRIVGQ